MPPVLWCSQSPEGGVVGISLKVEPSRVTCSQYLDKLWIPALTPVKTNSYLMRLTQNLSWEPPDLLYLSVHFSAISYHVTLRSIGAKPWNTSSDNAEPVCMSNGQPTYHAAPRLYGICTRTPGRNTQSQNSHLSVNYLLTAQLSPVTMCCPTMFTAERAVSPLPLRDRLMSR